MNNRRLYNSINTIDGILNDCIAEIEELEATIEGRDTEIEQLKDQIEERDNLIDDLNEVIRNLSKNE